MGDDDGHHDLRLAEAVDEASDPGAGKCLDDHVDGGDDARHAVRPGHALDEEDDSQPQHCDGHSGDETGQGELESTG